MDHTKPCYNRLKSIEKWARHKVRPKDTEYNQRQEQMRSVFCGINAFMIYEIGSNEEMREILFRAKHKEWDEWVEGDLIHEPFGDCIQFIKNECRSKIKVNPETVCQYTGLTDKNGRKIFEGDICKDGDNVVRVLWNDKHQWGVEISKTDFVLSKGLIFPLWQYDKCEENGNRELEVIGNIFDNPELIGDQP